MYRNKSIIFLIILCNTAFGQVNTTEIRFNSPCFKNVIKTNKSIMNNAVNGYDCEFVFVPDVQVQSNRTRKVYYKDWWNFFITKQGNYIDIYPLNGNNAKAHVRINKLTDSSKVLYQGAVQTIQRKDFDVKFDTDDWEIDTLSQLIKIIQGRTFKYKAELITVINIEGWNLYVPQKCKKLEGYSLIYSNKRGFIGSYIYFLPKEDKSKTTSYSFIGDQKLKQFMKERQMIYYHGGGIWWECAR